MVAADMAAEPLPPGGFTEQQMTDAIIGYFGPELGVEIIRWMNVTWPAWAREAATRADKASAFCKVLSAKAEESATAP
jgi:hypothetical protein